MTGMEPSSADGERIRASFTVPSRGLLGFRALFATATHGTGVINRRITGYELHRGPLGSAIRPGVLISMADGVTSTYGLNIMQPRGTLFVGAQSQIYGGQIIGEHNRDNDLDVSIARGAGGAGGAGAGADAGAGGAGADAGAGGAGGAGAGAGAIGATPAPPANPQTNSPR